MNLKKVGFFKELEHGDEDGVSLKELLNNHPEENEDKIINYLNNGIELYIAPGVVFDVLNESKGIVTSLEILTDGEWIWPSDLSYYVAQYHVSLDKRFLEHIKKNDWTIPNKDKINLSKLNC